MNKTRKVSYKMRLDTNNVFVSSCEHIMCLMKNLWYNSTCLLIQNLLLFNIFDEKSCFSYTIISCHLTDWEIKAVSR